MPLFFFEISGDGLDGVDDLGCEFGSVEAAFVDAYQSMVRIAAEMLLEHKDPGALVVTILAENREALMTLSYDEVCRRAPPRMPATDIRNAVRLQIERSRTLTAEVHSAFQQVHASLEAVRDSVSRARSLA